MPMGLAPDIAMHRAEAAHFDGFASVRGLKGEAEQLAAEARCTTHPRFTLLANAEVTQLIGTPGSPTNRLRRAARGWSGAARAARLSRRRRAALAAPAGAIPRVHAVSTARAAMRHGTSAGN